MEDNREVKEEQKAKDNKDKKGKRKLDTGNQAKLVEIETATGDKARRTLLGKRAGKHDKQKATMKKKMKLEQSVVKGILKKKKTGRRSDPLKKKKKVHWSNPLTKTAIYNVNKKMMQLKLEMLKMVKQAPKADQKVQKSESPSKSPKPSTNGNASPPATPEIGRPWVKPPNTPCLLKTPKPVKTSRGTEMPLLEEEKETPLCEKSICKKKAKNGKKKAKHSEKTDKNEDEKFFTLFNLK